MTKTEQLGTESIPKLLKLHAIPAAIGILTLSINGIIDNIFVGHYVGSIAIAAITVVLPITFLIASVGMAIGVGGASIISRALGSGDEEKAYYTFGNQFVLVAAISLLLIIVGYFFQDEVLMVFGGRGNILPSAKTYFNILLPAVPFLAYAMMSNNVIRAVGKSNVAMMVMMIPAFVNIALDYVLIAHLGWGLEGAAWATMISYIASALYALYYFEFLNKEIKIACKYLKLKREIINETVSIGFVTLARQGTVSLLAIFLNNALFKYGAEESVAIWGIISRMLMFASFPVFGVVQGFLPIAGFNFGAEKFMRVRETIYTSIKYGTLIAFFIFLLIMLFTPQIISIFTNEDEIITKATPAMRTVFLMIPTLTIQLIGAAYYQAIGNARSALLLTMTKQGFFLIPLILILPNFYGIWGIWMAFPIADFMTAIVNSIALAKASKSLLKKETT